MESTLRPRTAERVIKKTPHPFSSPYCALRQSHKQHSSSLSLVLPQSRCSAKSPWMRPISSTLSFRPCMTTVRVQQKNIFFACLARRGRVSPCWWHHGDGHLSRYGECTVLIQTLPSIGVYAYISVRHIAMHVVHVFFARNHIFKGRGSFDGTNQHPLFYASLNCHSSV